MLALALEPWISTRACAADPERLLLPRRPEAIARSARKPATGVIVCSLSRGVDSAVAVALIDEAVGDRLPCILVDHALMRESEAKEVVALFSRSRQGRSSGSEGEENWPCFG